MTTYLLIAGHGPQRNGTFDPGATGYITKGEYRYMVEDVFPAMKKYQPETDNFIYFSDHKVSNHGTLKQLADRYGADEVIELHFDAFNSTARGGHVIIHADYAPDAMDLRLKDAIGSMMKDTNFDGLRFEHRGHRGISGRTNLYNVNMARREGITYRLLELGFGTNKREADIMINRVDEYAKKLVEAILNTKIDKETINQSKPLPEKVEPDNDKNLNFNQVVAKTISGGYGNMPEREHNINSRTNFTYREIQDEINLRKSGNRVTSQPEPSFKVGSKVLLKNSARTYATGERIPDRIKGKTYTVRQHQPGRVLLAEIVSWVRESDLANNNLPQQSSTPLKPDVGDTVTISNNARTYATGETIPSRIKGHRYTIQSVKNDRVLLREIYSWVRISDLAGSSSSTKRSIEEMAREIINNPQAPNGHENRRRWLGISQSEYEQVRRRVNQLLS